MDKRVTRSANRIVRGRGRSARNSENLHVIKTNVPVTVSNTSEVIRTVTMAPKSNVQNPEPPEVKNISPLKTAITTKIFSAQKGAAMSFTKKKINAAKNFLKQQNKASPVKKIINLKVSLTEDNLKPSLSNNNSPNLVNNNSLPSTSNINMASNSANENSANENSTSNTPDNSKPRNFKPISISHQSHSVLALYEIDTSLKKRNIGPTKVCIKKGSFDMKEKKDPVAQKEVVILQEKKELVAQKEKKEIVSQREKKDIAGQKEKEIAAQKEKEIAAQKEKEIAAQKQKEIAAQKQKEIAAQKEKKEIAAQKERKAIFAHVDDSGSSWVPVNMKKTNTSKDSSVNERNNLSIKSKNFALTKTIEKNQNQPVFGTNVPKAKKKTSKEMPQKMFGDTKGERTVIRRYSNSLRHSLSRQEEERYYEKKYGISPKSKGRRSIDYEREHKQRYRESNLFSQKSQKTKKSFQEEEALEDVSDVPLDEDFEEVETASLEDANKSPEIPVGFRKYKIRYLASKSIGFFKPKRYDVCQDRTVVSCLNMEEAEEETVDVISEAEYEMDQSALTKDSENDKLNENNNLKNISETVKEPMEIENTLQVPGKVEGKSKSSKHIPNSSEEKLTDTVDLNHSSVMDTTSTNTVLSIKSIKKKHEVVSGSKLYYTSLSESDSSVFYQGHSVNQKYFDEWNSHLIG